MSRIDKTRPFIAVRIAVLTVSDTRSLAEDKSGDLLVSRLIEADHILAARDICTDDVDAITKQLKRFIADTEIDCVISTGGTGLPDVMLPLKRSDLFLKRKLKVLVKCSDSCHFRKLALLHYKAAQLRELQVAPICLPYLAHPLPAVMPGMIYWHISWIIGTSPVILLKLCRDCVKRA